MNEFDDVIAKLAVLEPTKEDQPQAADEAFAALQLRLNEPEAAPQSIPWLRRILTMTTRQKWARATLGGALGLLIAFFGFTTSGQAIAGEFLGLFRVQKFAPISISPEALANLEELDLEGLYPGEVAWDQEPSEPQPVASIDEAIALAPGAFVFTPDLGEPAEIAVGGAGSGTLTVDLAAARAILGMAGVDGNLLPDSLNGADISATTQDGIFMHWEEGDTTLVQMPSPEVNYPNDFDPQPIGQALLQFLGMSEAEAVRLSTTIDWTSTLILPIPAELGSFQEVLISGNPGILVTANDGSGSSIIFETGGTIVMLSGDWSADELIALANG